jgi:nitroimidazol reductase NimA-like FMN-containing flavoprotein (pyridoxamine 5'-phosphate oxidase superfamily)
MRTEQRRGRAIAMTPDERNRFLAYERICRVATVGLTGAPHNSALWFVWYDDAIWLYSIVKSQRWRNFERVPRVSVLIDAGEEYFELRGVELLGTIQILEQSAGTNAYQSEIEVVESLFGEKYWNGIFKPDGKHIWVRLSPDKIVSWDFRKLAALDQ